MTELDILIKEAICVFCANVANTLFLQRIHSVMLLEKKSWAGNLNSSLRFASKLYIILKKALNFYASFKTEKRKKVMSTDSLNSNTLLWHRSKKNEDDTL